MNQRSIFRMLIFGLFLSLLIGIQPASAQKYPPYTVDLNGTVVLQASNGNHIQCYFITPKERERPLPVVIIVPPGGQEAGTIFPYANHFATNGMGVFCFDPEGRGKSEGVEDYNGPSHQDDLATIIKYLRSIRSEVDYRNIGILSFYDGTTMATGTLNKNPKLDVKYLIDIEGPGTRDEWVKLRAPIPPGVGMDNFFWKDREALTFTERIFCRYLRLQAKTDHALNDDKTYAINMYNKTLKGKSPWVRCNYNGTYQELDPQFPGKYQWLRKMDPEVVYRFVQEMAQMEPLPESFKN